MKDDAGIHRHRRHSPAVNITNAKELTKDGAIPENLLMLELAPLFRSSIIAEKEKSSGERLKMFLNKVAPQLMQDPFIIVDANMNYQKMSVWLNMHRDNIIYSTGRWALQEYEHKGETYNNKYELASCPNMIARITEGAYFARYEASSTDPTETVLIFVNERGLSWNSQKVREFLLYFVQQLNDGIDTNDCDPKAMDRVILNPELVTDIEDDFSTFLKSRRLYKETLKLPWKRGYMLIGGPGNGKTSLIRSLCKKYGLKFSDIKNSIKHDGSLDLDPELEDSIEGIYYPDKIKPHVFILEDIDKFVAYQCGEADKDAGAVSLHEVLKAIDGIQSISDVILMATTNYPNRMSEALINRPGRFDRIFQIDAPKAPEIARFIKMHNIVIKDMNVDDLALELDGCSMAFVEEFVKSLRTIFLATEFTANQARSVIKRIKKHQTYCNKMFGKNQPSIGFGGGG